MSGKEGPAVAVNSSPHDEDEGEYSDYANLKPSDLIVDLGQPPQPVTAESLSSSGDDFQREPAIKRPKDFKEFVKKMKTSSRAADYKRNDIE